MVWYSTKWKEMGEQNPKLIPAEADMARLFERLDNVTESLVNMDRRDAARVHIRSKEIPAMVRVGRTKVVSGKMDDLKQCSNTFVPGD